MDYRDDIPEAPGDWRVDHEVCMACGAPPMQAPELMGFGNNHANPKYAQCYFNRQPQTKQEHDRAFKAAEFSCCGAVRYCGNDPELVRRMKELDASTVGPIPVATTQCPKCMTVVTVKAVVCPSCKTVLRLKEAVLRATVLSLLVLLIYQLLMPVAPR